MKIKSIIILLLTLTTTQQLWAQKNYQSLLWQISGKGLRKPSYLYGTMHVSDKIAFNLGDSFFTGIKSVDHVALEFNPSVVVEEMISSNYMSSLLKEYADHIYSARNRSIQKNMFFLPEPAEIRERLRYDIASRPEIINFLLYRYGRTGSDFEEDTYLDLYIYQTARKLNKKVGAVENFEESLRLTLEAEQDMAEDNEKQDRSRKLNNVDVGEEIDNAYRRGDLDAIDSIYTVVYTSKRYLEKMLYIRNANMAKCMDSIMQHETLFTAVGAAHLPGRKGIIQILREMGYTVQPVQTGKRNARMKSNIDETEVPFSTRNWSSFDQQIQLNTAGDLLHWNSDPMEMNYFYSDQANGAFYSLCRVKTYSAFRGFTEQYMLQSIDSFLYEYVPGDILSKNSVEINGYKGYDILSKNRRGNIQRYVLAVSPFELLLFKASGTGEFIRKSGAFYFKNITLAPSDSKYTEYQSTGSGFKMQLPGKVITNFDDKNPTDFSLVNPRTFQAMDAVSSIHYLCTRFTVNNLDYIDEDTFELAVLEKSVIKEMRYKIYNRSITPFGSRKAISSTYRAHDSSWVRAFYVFRGAHAYVLLARTADKNLLPRIDSVFSTFQFTPLPSPVLREVKDTTMGYTVMAPDVALGSKDILNNDRSAQKNKHLYRGRRFYYVNTATDEQITVDVDRFHRYSFALTTDTFWYNRMIYDMNPGGWCVVKEKKFSRKGDVQTLQVILTDTNTSRVIHKTMHMRGRYLYTIAQIYDAEDGESNFWKTFNQSFTITDTSRTRFPFEPVADVYLNDLTSQDSSIRAEAEASVDFVLLKRTNSSTLIRGIQQLSPDNKKYIQLKSMMLKSFGYCTDTTAAMSYLRKAYMEVSDTSTLQVAMLEALAEMNTKSSFQLLSELIRMETPILYSSYELNPLFNTLANKQRIRHTALLFPGLLQLCTFEDYKFRVYELLGKLTDSTIIKPTIYAGYLTQILNDARVEMKKKANNKNEYSSNSSNYNLYTFNTLLVHFATQPSVRHYFDKMLLSKDIELKLRTAALLTANHQFVPDSIWNNYAANYKYNYKLFEALHKTRSLHQFPKKFISQQKLALGQAYDQAEGNSYRKLDTVIFITTEKVKTKNGEGLVYIFRYKNEKEQDWNLVFCGMQPTDTSVFYLNETLCSKTTEIIEDGEIAKETIRQELDDLILNSRRKGFPKEYTGNNQ